MSQCLVFLIWSKALGLAQRRGFLLWSKGLGAAAAALRLPDLEEAGLPGSRLDVIQIRHRRVRVVVLQICLLLRSLHLLQRQSGDGGRRVGEASGDLNEQRDSNKR